MLLVHEGRRRWNGGSSFEVVVRVGRLDCRLQRGDAPPERLWPWVMRASDGLDGSNGEGGSELLDPSLRLACAMSWTEADVPLTLPSGTSMGTISSTLSRRSLTARRRRSSLWCVASFVSLSPPLTRVQDWWLSPELFLRRPPTKHEEVSRCSGFRDRKSVV